MIAARPFVGVVGGKEKPFATGDTITKEEAKELGLNLKRKKHLVIREKK